MLVLTHNNTLANIAADLSIDVVLAAQVTCKQAADDITLIKSAFGHFKPVQWQGDNCLGAGQLSSLIGCGNRVCQDRAELFDLYCVGVVFQSQNNIVHR